MGIGNLKKWAATGVALLMLLTAHPAAGQEHAPPVVEFAAGSLLFADDGIVNEKFAGGAVRFYLSPRIGIGPEITYVRGERHSHLIATGNVTCDLLAPAGGRPRRVTPFVVVGGGLFQTREEFETQTFQSSEGAFTAGGGVRAGLSERVSAGIETRIGWELHIRVNGFVGIRLGR
jgi:hypothetical protein